MLSTEAGLATVARQMAEALESCQNTLDDAAPRYETGAGRCPPSPGGDGRAAGEGKG